MSDAVDAARTYVDRARADLIGDTGCGDAYELSLIESLCSTIVNLRDLVKHAWIHSGYHNCGYRQMTTEQKALYDSVTRDGGDVKVWGPYSDMEEARRDAQRAEELEVDEMMSTEVMEIDGSPSDFRDILAKVENEPRDD